MSINYSSKHHLVWEPSNRAKEVTLMIEVWILLSFCLSSKIIATRYIWDDDVVFKNFIYISIFINIVEFFIVLVIDHNHTMVVGLTPG